MRSQTAAHAITDSSTTYKSGRGRREHVHRLYHVGVEFSSRTAFRYHSSQPHSFFDNSRSSSTVGRGIFAAFSSSSSVRVGVESSALPMPRRSSAAAAAFIPAAIPLSRRKSTLWPQNRNPCAKPRRAEIRISHEISIACTALLAEVGRRCTSLVCCCCCLTYPESVLTLPNICATCATC